MLFVGPNAANKMYVAHEDNTVLKLRIAVKESFIYSVLSLVRVLCLYKILHLSEGNIDFQSKVQLITLYYLENVEKWKLHNLSL